MCVAEKNLNWNWNELYMKKKLKKCKKEVNIKWKSTVFSSDGRWQRISFQFFWLNERERCEDDALWT